MTQPAIDVRSGLFCLGLMSRLLGAPISAEQLRHQFSTGQDELAPLMLARAFRRIGFKVRLVDKPLARLRPELYPVVAPLHGSGYAMLARLDIDKRQVLVQEEGTAQPHWEDIDQLQQRLRGTIMLLKRKERQLDGEQRFGLGWFFRAARKYGGVFRDCLLASLFVQLFALLSPLVFMIVIDKVLSNNSLTTLDVLVLALVIVSIFEIALNGLRTYLLSHTANRMDLMLGVAVFKHLMSLPLSYFESRRVGDTIARMRELDNVRRFITGSGLMLLLDLFFVVVFLLVMYLFSPFLLLIVLISLPFLFAASFLMTPLLRNRLEDTYSSGADNQSFLVETISGIETIKAGAAEPRLQAKWEARLTDHVKNGFQSGLLANLVNQITAVASKALTVLLLYFGAKEVLYGNLTVGQLIAFNMISSRVVAPIVRLSQIWKEFQHVRISVARIGDIFRCPAEPGFDPFRVSLPDIAGAVTFERVMFGYGPDGSPVLSDVSFSVQAGEVIGIVGSTGSGKTTLAKLLQRLYVPRSGRVLIDGVDLSMADASWLRRQIGVVVQDGVLFNGSIRDNIALNGPDLPLATVIEAAELAGAHGFIMDFPHGYDTSVGERGVQLSTGQRQRLAIARALATDPRMLILDEATSSLDYESELLIQQKMRQICRGRTVFIIAHRLSSVRHADRIITLERGRIDENDTPEALLAAGGRYATLHSIHEGRYACL
ncbi:type I secretion system permease/ATPase [Desulfofustis glycolicus]|uniref:ATP-binding cassette, subfamily B, HlyB/CyaB n=1 Tax=Desulfofustis glycolicus DSM 9705 TaxID=1121409 RepID=A0A1M5YQE9_9BACT|nr:type I secretion system permease/ATPase [Desulfofustis glycolicus]SHI14080.1 ATP-binding cassette, subfamily B, HlyB/CyaB [Desulfofustis glycolicus DSM 9705]